MKLVALKDVPEMFNGQVHSRKFTSECSTTCFCCLQFLEKKTTCSSLATERLFQDSSGSGAGDVGHETSGGLRSLIEKQGCIGRSFFQGGKS